jgi:hypothetical protein
MQIHKVLNAQVGISIEVVKGSSKSGEGEFKEFDKFDNSSTINELFPCS